MAAPDEFDVQLDNVLQIDGEGSSIQRSYYYDLDEFSKLMKIHNTDSNISVLNINARSLIKCFNELSAILQDLPSLFDVITVEETWLSETLEPLVQLRGYTFFAKHKKKCKEGGGIGIYVKNEIDFVFRDDLECPKEFQDIFDYMFIEIKHRAPLKNDLVGVIYRPPGSDTVYTLTHHLKDLLPKLNKENKTIVLTSDMNINLLQCSNHQPTAFYYDTLLCNGYLPKITSPTRVTHSTATLIDHIFVNECKNKQSFSGTITSSMSDHYFNFIFLNNANKPERPKTMTYRPLTEANISKFNAALSDLDFSSIYETTDPNEAYDKLINAYNETLDRVIPLKTVRFNKHKHSLNPWASKEILLSIKYRDKLHSNMKKAKNSSQRSKLEKSYNDYRVFLHKKIKTAKRNYEKELFKKCKNDSKSIWKNINSILGKTPHKKNIPSKINDENGVTLSNLNDISNAFNDYYVNVGPNLAKKIGPSQHNYKKYLPNVKHHSSLFLRPTNDRQVTNIIKLLKPKTSCGHDSISPKILKKLYAGIITPCVHIINLSLATGKIPDAMKLAKVVPIYKNSGPTEIMKNYRPVSLLPVLSKVLERIVYNQLFEYLVKHALLHPSQYGFQPDLSTELAILELQDRITNILNNKECCVGVFMDLSKAFDTLDHEILINKLKHYGIRGIALNWFQDYLTGRQQYVSIDGINSTKLKISCGVPQGSILGPLLFLIYINDLATVSKTAITILFADDTNTIYTSNTYDSLKKIVCDDLQKISDWFKTNKLALNETKTKVMIFHKAHTKPPSSFTLTLNNIELERVENTKFLGIMIQENLSWNTHVKHICSKISKATALLAKLKHYMPKYVLSIIYNSLCISHMSYALSVWGAAPSAVTDRITKLQKKGIRHVCNSKYNAHTIPLFKRNKMLKFDDLFKFHCTKIMYKKMQHRLHSYHSNQLITNLEQNNTSTRQKFDVHVFGRHETNFTKINSINYKVGISWNELPFVTKTLAFKTLPTFTKNAKKFYLSKYSELCKVRNCYICK